MYDEDDDEDDDEDGDEDGDEDRRDSSPSLNSFFLFISPYFIKPNPPAVRIAAITTITMIIMIQTSMMITLHLSKNK